MKNETVLVIDDDRDIRESIRDILEMDGYQVHTAGNGREALDLLPTIESPSLILLDLMMPVMNGWEFLKELSEEFGLAGTPVIIITAFSDKFAKKGLATGVLNKPLDLDKLRDTVNRYSAHPQTVVNQSEWT